MTAPFSWMSAWDKKPVIDRPIRVIGIDLGTTNSTVTEIVWSPNSSEPPVTNLIQIPQETTNGQIVFDLVPSVVASHDDKIFVGTGAQRLRSSTALLGRNKQIWWDTKNEIGTRRIYAGAPEGFRTPWEIAAKILKFLNEAAIDESEMPIDRVVVTVPASFQLTQRKDTINAAKTAGIELKGQDLMAEPVAAFLDFLTWSKGEALSAKKVNRVMVVDFGGGTCDIALLQLTKSDAGNLEVANKGVSRFHRIGGSMTLLPMRFCCPSFLPKMKFNHLKSTTSKSVTISCPFWPPWQKC
jgi:molecular chaperone DnaK (HSP70)